MQISRAPGVVPTAADPNYREMNDLSKDAVNRVAVDEAGASIICSRMFMVQADGIVAFDEGLP